ncbi:hypothetical protein J6590_039174, partial [Homalodisca vitripennis]
MERRRRLNRRSIKSSICFTILKRAEKLSKINFPLLDNRSGLAGAQVVLTFPILQEKLIISDGSHPIVSGWGRKGGPLSVLIMSAGMPDSVHLLIITDRHLGRPPPSCDIVDKVPPNHVIGPGPHVPTFLQ